MVLTGAAWKLNAIQYIKSYSDPLATQVSRIGIVDRRLYARNSSPDLTPGFKVYLGPEGANTKGGEEWYPKRDSLIYKNRT